MSKYVGVTWTPAGLFGVILREDGDPETDFFPSVWSLWKYHSNATRILVDVPLGLPVDSRRTCDVEAKRLLGEYHQRLFYTPTRQAVYEQHFETAKRVNERAGFSIQNQVWALVPRIRELDEFLDRHHGAIDRIAETRPELCFFGFNDRTPVEPSRRTPEGNAHRLDLLETVFEEARPLFESCRDRYLSPDYASFLRDEADILDAMVTAVAARRPGEQLGKLPPATDPPRDDRGLPMQLVYPRLITQTRLSNVVDGG